ncbi:MAG TPA: hypothetical protein VG650_00965 [Mycobacteriales bacterium]|nr:hypothetical protein [Mycobacteriales bacterium]
MRRMSVVVVLSALAIGSPLTAFFSGNAVATPATTTVTHVRPVDASGHLLPGYKVTRRFGNANCLFGSEATGTAYRCFAGNFVIDPCWVTDDPAYVDCLSEGWSHSVARLHVTKGYDNSGYTRAGSRGKYPWDVEVVGGIRCGWLQGASGVVGKYRVDYGCGKTPKTVLIGGVDRSKPVWTIRKAHDTGNYHYKQDGRAKLAEAWYGKPSRKGSNS